MILLLINSRQEGTIRQLQSYFQLLNKCLVSKNRTTGLLGNYRQQAERRDVKGRFAKAVMSSPPTPALHTKEKESSYKARETAKTLYGSCDSVDGGRTSSDTVGMLWVIVKHVKREHIESFYSTSPSKFVIVLKQPNLKEH